MLPKTEPSRPVSIMGWRMIIKTPIKLMSVPIITRLFGFSFKKSIEPIMRNIGAEEPMIGALMLADSSSPKRR